jgi:hypothetical protein
MPARKVRGGDISNFAVTHKSIQRIKRLLDWGGGVEAVEVIDVHVIGLEPVKAGLERTGQMLARGTDVDGFIAETEG